MMNAENGEICWLSGWIGLTMNPAPCGIFTCLSNLAVIVTVAENPSPQRPSNILLCSLAFTDFLTAVTAQPLGTSVKARRRRRQREPTKAIGSMSKTTILYVHHAFLYISLPSLHDYDIKMPNFTIYRGSIQATTKFRLSFWTWI